MTVKERLQQHLDTLSDEELLWLEQQLIARSKKPLSPQEKTDLWKPLIGMLDSPETEAAFDEAVRRRPLTTRQLDLEP